MGGLVVSLLLVAAPGLASGAKVAFELTAAGTTSAGLYRNDGTLVQHVFSGQSNYRSQTESTQQAFNWRHCSRNWSPITLDLITQPYTVWTGRSLYQVHVVISQTMASAWGEVSGCHFGKYSGTTLFC